MAYRLTQPALAVEGLKWVGFFVLGYTVLVQRRGYLLFVAVVLFEFVQGIGFFSGFKTVIFVTAMVVFTVHHRLKGSSVGIGVVAFAVLLVLGAAWTSIKVEYRAFLNQGSGMQETVVSRDEQIDKLTDLVGALQWEDITLAIHPLLSRVAYVDYFALAMDYVPAVIPHEDGRVWKEALQHTLMPRLFFPDKPRLVSDSEHTSYYTGMMLASDDDGTSISIGYLGDSYIDFGPWGMYVAVFLIGLLWGGVYRYFLARGSSAILAFGFAMASLLAAYQFEVPAIKLVSGIVIKFVVLAAVMRFFEPTMRRWLGIEKEEWEEDEAVSELAHA